MPCDNGRKYIGDNQTYLHPITNAQKCQEQCQIDRACIYWTWDLYNWELNKHGVCSKKSSKSWEGNNAYSISGNGDCMISDTPPKGMGTMLY